MGGKTPFGYVVSPDGRLVEVPEQQRAIREMVHLKEQGKALRAIAESMKAQGYRISHVAVKDILNRARLQSR
ncbi:hypothetical protein MAE02_36920 [Microvirga aerophila]|uniref:Recombinase domain-containing protein n=1 Tax=Microvirga aerophila TaxID=670291 RepID=A0A512BVK6_9HYPH|nr:hypothetical protein MAE02_36920 [Microvirga aerophila]